MRELENLERGDEVRYEMRTVYQPDDADWLIGEFTVASVEFEEDDDGERVATNVYFEYKADKNGGNAVRRARKIDGDLKFERVRGDPANPTCWAKLAGEELKFTRAKCGSETDDGTCGMTAGWGTEHAGRGKCKHHDTNPRIDTLPNVEVDSKVVEQVE